MLRSRILVFSLPVLLVAAVGAKTEPVANDPSDEAVPRDTTPPFMSLYLPIPLGVPGVEAQSTGRVPRRPGAVTAAAPAPIRPRAARRSDGTAL